MRWKIDRWEFAVSIITTLGVVALDILNGILMAVLIAIHLLLMRVSRPPDAVLGRVSGLKGFHNIIHHEQARTWADLVLYRFGAALVFSMRRISRSACWRWLPPSTYRGDHAGSLVGRLAHAGDPSRLCQPPNRGSHLAGAFRRFRRHSAMVRYFAPSNQPWMLAPPADLHKHRKREQNRRRQSRRKSPK
jgi:hypothetical protein